MRIDRVLLEYCTERVGGNVGTAEDVTGAAGESAGGRGARQRRASALPAAARTDRQAATSAGGAAQGRRGEARRGADRERLQLAKDRRQTRTASALSSVRSLLTLL